MIAIATLLTGSSVWSAVRPATAFSIPELSAGIPTLTDGLNEELDEPRIDLYGNEIQDAVGDYRVDPGGDLYEGHSPDTEVLHLAPPKT
jgi:hypothetical protein